MNIANLLAMTGSYFIDVDTITGADSILHAVPMSHASGISPGPTPSGGKSRWLLSSASLVER